MSKITAIGAVVMDTIVSLESYPTEDTKVKALTTKSAGGGPAGTGIVAAAKLGAQCSFIGNLSDDAGGVFLKGDFEKYGVSTDYIKIHEGKRSFISQIWLSAKEKTRTIIFDRGNVPGTVLDDAQKKEISECDVLMVDGNDLEGAIEAAKYAHTVGTKVLYDAGGRYEGVERLLPLVDILIPSEEFALGVSGKATVEEAVEWMYNEYSAEVVVATCGKRGGVIYEGDEPRSYPALPAEVVDSNGAGDVFHGAFAFASTVYDDYYKCCIFSSAVSAIKCMGIGARESVPDLETVQNYLKENGYEL